MPSEMFLTSLLALLPGLNYSAKVFRHGNAMRHQTATAESQARHFRQWRTILLVFALVACLGSAACAFAGQSSDPVFNDLDGTPRRPLEVGSKAATVLIFYWHDCPVCNSYAPEINRIFLSYTNFAFYIVQVDPDLTLAAAKAHARAYQLRPPVLLDPQHRLVRIAKATVTPEAIVLGKNAKELYRGRIDDLYPALGTKRSSATQHDLRDALDAIAAGRSVTNRQTQAIGCLISTPSASN